MGSRIAVLLGISLFASTQLEAAFQETSTLEGLNAEAMKAYEAKDYPRFLEYEKRALQLQPSSPRLIYNVACGEALRGDAHEAVRLLNQLLARKLDLGAENDSDFANIRTTPEWVSFESGLAELRKPLVRSRVAFTLQDPDIVATGIAVDSRTGDTYIASVRHRKILRRSKTGVFSDFIREGQDGFLAGASIAVDPARQVLFASTAAVPYMLGYHQEDLGQSGVFAFDLKSGKLVRKAMIHADGKRHFLNALAVDRRGNVYASDSGSPGIYELRRGASELELLVGPKVFAATQGIALSEDEKTLFVADYADGLWALDLTSKSRRRIEGPADTWLGGLDGLSRVRNELIAVQIGLRPQRVLRLKLDQEGGKVTTAEVLEMNHPEYEGPIQGAVTGNEFLYVANSQLDLGNGETGAFASERGRPTVVLRLPL